MAKFLPFVVEKSTPTHIYQTLISRSKGANMVDVTSVFYAVLGRGIKEIRFFTSELPDMDLNKVYVEILNKYPQYRIDSDLLRLFQDMGRHIKKYELSYTKSEELADYDMKDLMMFYLVITLHDSELLNEYTDIHFDVAADQEEVKNVFDNIGNYGLFSSEGELKHFTDKYDLAAYVVYAVLLRDSKLPTVKAEYKKEKKSKRQ